MEWNIGEIATKRSILTPDKTAIFFNDTPISYKILNDRVNSVANYLKKKGLEKGDRVAVILKNCPELIEIYFAAAKLGLIFVPMNFRLMGQEFAYQLNDSGSRCLFFHATYTETIDSIRSQTKVDKNKFVYITDQSDNTAEYPDWAEDYYGTMKDYSCDEPLPDEKIHLDDPLAIIYTSGVTGTPKGAMVSHGQTFFKCFQNIFYTDMRSEDIYLSQLPLFHSGGLFVVATPCFCQGSTIVMRQNFNPEQFAEDIENYKATIIFALTTMWRFILQTNKLDEVDLSSVRVVLGGGERTPKNLFEDLSKKGLHMQQVFGQTENSIMMVLPKKDVQKKMGSIGLPGFFTDVWIGDGKGRELPHGTIGEIVAKGPNVMMGYWNKPDKTAETIVNGVLFTGDLGYRDEDGYFYIVDRSKDMYRSGGENVYPAEIEKILIGHPKVLNIAIIGVVDEKWGETGMAFVVQNEGETLTKDDISDYLEGKIAKYKRPTHVKFIDELPMTSSGKMKKIELKEKYGTVFNESH